jgi:hypothetical protein
MDDKWDAFVERDRLFLHRSWSGRGVYEARFTKSEIHWRISEAVVENDRTSYRRASDEAETLGLELIIESVLLQRFHQREWERWQTLMARDLAAARLPPGKLYEGESEVLMGRDGRWIDVQQFQEFELGVWLHVCIGSRWGRFVSEVE